MTKWRSLSRSLRKSLRTSVWPRILVGALAALLITALVLDRALDEPLRRQVERRMNAALDGYTAKVGAMNFDLLTFSVDLENVAVSQNAHPDPAVLVVPSLAMSVHWRDLLYARLVADAVFDKPSVYVNLVQLQEEARDQVPFDERGWQDALEAIYPLKINELWVQDGSLVYEDDSEFRPLHLSRVEFAAHNIRNIRSRDREYPSDVHAEGAVFDLGRIVIDGHADFMAEPHPGVRATIDLDDMQLDYFEPVVRRYNLAVRQGLLTATGLIEYAPGIQIVDLGSVLIADASIDYIHGGEPSEAVKKVAREIKETAREAMNNPEVLFRVRHLVMEDGTIGLVNRAADPDYRVFVSNADFELRNLSNRAEDGIAHASLDGSFMGTGKVHGTAELHPEGKSPNFNAKLEIAETQMKPMNDMLRAHGGFDVVAGVFSLYTEVRVRDGYIDGYVKPMFRDVDVYDSEQDKKKNVFRKMYEGLVGGVAKILENRRRDEVATVAKISGPVEDPNSNTLQVVARLIQNAFFKAIVPGFEREVARDEPVRYRAAKRAATRRGEAGRRKRSS